MNGEPSNIVGNLYDKYQTRNPFARWLMAGFLESVTDLYRRAAPKSVLEVGCGEGRLAHHLVTRGHRPERFEACDLELTKIAEDLDSLITFKVASIYDLPYEAKSFDLVVCCEVLEHLERPKDGLRELCRVARRSVILSTPREPLWRALNVLRGKYWSELGNTPGHLQHFGQSELISFLENDLVVEDKRAPIPWTVVIGRPRT